MSRFDSDIFIVGLNIDKQDGYHGRLGGSLVKLTHGVYMKSEADAIAVFAEFAFRIASVKYRFAAITHSSAWYRSTIDVMDAYGDLTDVHLFIGGDFPYKVEIGKDLIRGKKNPLPEFRIIQTASSPATDDSLQYTLETFTDSIGDFQMYCATPELVMLQVMEAHKRHPEKSPPVSDYPEIAQALLERHGGDPYAVLQAIDVIATRTDSSRMFYSFVNTFLPHLRDAV